MSDNCEEFREMKVFWFECRYLCNFFVEMRRVASSWLHAAPLYRGARDGSDRGEGTNEPQR